MPKLRHIAYRADDVEGMASFFANAFDMDVVERRKNGAIDLSDGVMNITILPSSLPRGAEQGVRTGIDHLGFTTDDEDSAREAILAAGGAELQRVDLGSGAHYEVKFQGPEGIVVDLGHWAGTAPVNDAALSGAGVGKREP
jgi:catechol 2,3-dioxygenase-like lactoylglutathione lyase family enzyme